MITKIKDKLYNQKDLIVDILNDLGAENINYNTNSNEIRWGGKGGSKIKVDTLSYTSFSHGTYGDIITFVAEMKNITIGDAIRWLGKKLNITYEDIEKVEVKLPFGGFFKDYSKTKDNDENLPPTYDKKRLEEFNLGVSKLFIEDGISAQTQEEFGIGYDSLTDRITIPWFSVEEELIGVMGRKNKKKITEKENKYLPIISFQKSKALYGLNVNYRNILEKNCMVIVESEKSVLKSKQYNMNNVVALGGNQISAMQQKLIKSMHCDIIIALDEGLELEHCITQAKKVKIHNPFFSNNVYVLEMEGLEEKCCIFDLPYEDMQQAFKERLIYIG